MVAIAPNIYQCDRLWHFRVLANNSIYGQANGYYTAQAAEEAGRQWVGDGW